MPPPAAGPSPRDADAGWDRLADVREDYQQRGLRRADLAGDPFIQFQAWFDAWAATDPYDASAVVLATVDADGRPSARYVLLKGLVDAGFVFFTNLASRKGSELAANPSAALCFGWLTVERQVRVEGSVSQVTDEEADAYFARRPRGSQLGAWASDQSAPVAGRSALEARLDEATQRFADGDVPRPPHWGGYRLTPSTVEFWQGRANRLHDRFIYTRHHAEPTGWRIARLSP